MQLEFYDAELTTAENETELSLFNRKDYEEFKKDPEIKWD